MSESCLLCRWSDADEHFRRIQVWEDRLWRVTTSLVAPVLGFSYLEPKRHISFITDLDGDEALALGETLAYVTKALKAATDARLVYVNVFGDRVSHLHFNLAPHRDGDALQGGVAMIAPGAEPLDADQLEAVALDFGRRLARHS